MSYEFVIGVTFLLVLEDPSAMCSASVFACSEFYLFPPFATSNMDVWFVLRKPMVTSAGQGDASFLMKKKHCFRLSFQPCFGHSILFQEKSLFCPWSSHPISLIGLEAVIRNLHFLLQFRTAQWVICFVGNSQNPDLTAQIKMLI